MCYDVLYQFLEKVIFANLVTYEVLHGQRRYVFLLLCLCRFIVYFMFLV